MRNYQYAQKEKASQSSRTTVPHPSEVQPSAQPSLIQAKSNEEGLAEHAERLRKFQRLGNSFIQMGPPRLDNGKASSLQFKPWIQRKLTIGEPGDKYEREANRVASQVVEQINTPCSTETNIRQSIQREKDLQGKMQAKGFEAAIQCKQAIADREATPNLESAINSVRGRGQALDPGLQQSMGQVMGADFSGVRVHTDAQSDQLSQSIQARAFTTGQDLFFQYGAYKTENRRGQELIAHELAHVVQQNVASFGHPLVQREFVVAGEDHEDQKEVASESQKIKVREKEQEWGKKTYKNYWKEDEFKYQYGTETAKMHIAEYDTRAGDPTPVRLLEDVLELHRLCEVYVILHNPLIESQDSAKKLNHWNKNSGSFKINVVACLKQFGTLFKTCSNWLDEMKHEDMQNLVASQERVNYKKKSREILNNATLKNTSELLKREEKVLDQFPELKENKVQIITKVIPTFLLAVTELKDVLGEYKNYLQKWRKLKDLSSREERSYAMHRAAVDAHKFHVDGLWKVGNKHVKDIQNRKWHNKMQYTLYNRVQFINLRDNSDDWSPST